MHRARRNYFERLRVLPRRLKIAGPDRQDLRRNGRAIRSPLLPVRGKTRLEETHDFLIFDGPDVQSEIRVQFIDKILGP